MKLSANTSLQIFSALQFGAAALLGILLAKSGLPTAQISVYEALIFIASLYCFFWIVGGQNALLQLFPKLQEAEKPAALFSTYVLFTLAGWVTAASLFFSQSLVHQYLTNLAELPHLDLLVVFMAFHCPGFLIHLYYLLLKKYRQIVAFAVMSFSLQVAAVVLPLFFGATLRESVWGLVAWAVFRFCWGWVLIARHARWRWDVVFVKNYLPLVLPLLLLGLIGKGAEYASGLIVSTLFEDQKAFAIFRYGARELPLAVLMVGALATSLLPQVVENEALGLQRIKAATRRLSHLLYPLSILSILLSPWLFPLLFNPDFTASAAVFNTFTLLLTSRILLPQVVLMARQRNYVATLAAAIELILIIVLGLVLGKTFGLAGVAFATVIAFFIERIILMTYCYRAFGIAPSAYMDVRNYLIYNGLLLAAYIVSTWIY